MKKVLVASAALLLTASLAAPVMAKTSEPGVVLSGDARTRYIFKDNAAFGNRSESDQMDMDFRVRLVADATAAGGAYAKVRMRLSEDRAKDFDMDNNNRSGYGTNGNNLWVDMAYIGIPFNENFTLETGRYRSSYGPVETRVGSGNSANMLYDDVSSAGLKGIITAGSFKINPFIEWMDDGQDGRSSADPRNRRDDNDERRYGLHARYTINDDWAIGGMVGYQQDERLESAWEDWEQHDGFFGNIYINGKSGAFGLLGEFAVTGKNLNGFNNWRDDGYYDASNGYNIGSDDTGFGGYLFPNYTIGALNIGLHLGFTTGGFIPDYNFGFYMTGSEEPIRAMSVGEGGDWLWAGLVVNYKVSDDLKLTGNLVYADVDAWDNWGPNGEGPGGYYGRSLGSFDYSWGLENAWELSGRLQYTISKGLVLSWYAGYLKPEFDASYAEDDGYFASYAKFDLSF